MGNEFFLIFEARGAHFQNDGREPNMHPLLVERNRLDKECTCAVLMVALYRGLPGILYVMCDCLQVYYEIGKKLRIASRRIQTTWLRGAFVSRI